MKKIRLDGYVGPYDDINAKEINELLDGLNGEEIEVSLNSGGGSVYEGFEVYRAFNEYTGRKVLNLGALVASAATYMICAFDEVLAQDISTVMIHDVSTYTEGTAEELEQEAINMKAMQNQIAGLYAKRMGINAEEVNELMHATTWYRGQEIVDAKLATKFIDTGATNLVPIAVYKNQIKDYSNKIVEKKEDKVMDKKEILNEVVNQNITLNDVATKLNVADKIKTVEEITKLADYENKCKEVEKLKMENTLNSIFGVNSEENENLPRVMAETLYKTGLDVENIKKNPIMINLMAQKAAGEDEKFGKHENLKNKNEFHSEDY